MTESELTRFLDSRGIGDVVHIRHFADTFGISKSSLNNACCLKELNRTQRGTITRTSLVRWLVKNPKFLACVITQTPGTSRPSIGGLTLPNDYIYAVTLTVKTI